MINQLLAELVREFRPVSATPELDAELLLAHVLGQNRTHLLAHPETRLTVRQFDQLENLKNRRLESCPVAYLTNQREFWGRNFYVDEAVLIPRPETELLVEEALRLLFGEMPKYVLDIGTGSGCIAISLAKEISTHTYLATDISKRALYVANLNAMQHNATHLITFYRGHLLKPLFPTESIMTKHHLLIIANLPYTDYDRLDQEIDQKTYAGLKWEPREALDGGVSGLNLYHQFFQQLKKYQIHDSDILLEIAPSQKEALLADLQTLFPRAQVTVKKDLARQDRLMTIKI